MAQQVVVGDILRFTVVSFLEDQVGENVIHARVLPGLVGTPTDATAASGMDDFVAGLWKNCLSGVATYRGVSCRILRPNSPFAPQASTKSAGVGTISGTALPPQCRGLITLKTALAGPAYRGRLYLPFPSSGGTTTNGDMHAVYITALGNIGTFLTANAILSQGGASLTVTFGIYHRANRKDPAAPAIKGTQTDVTGYKVGLYYATQQRSGYLGRTNTLPF